MNSNGLLASVIMPCYRMDEFIMGALESVGKQTYSNWEVIVVDDCCPEGRTGDIVSAFAQRFQDHRIVTIRHEKNRGVSAARNTAIEAARGELYAFLDPDDYWMPAYLSENIRMLTEYPEYDVMSAPVNLLDENSLDKKMRVYGPNLRERQWFPSSLSCRNFLQPSSTVLRATAFGLTGGFDEDDSLQHVEDWDLWIRLLVSGAQFGILDEPSCVYRKHAGAATNDIAKMNRLTEILVKKHQGWFDRMRSQHLYLVTEELSDRELRSVLHFVRRIVGKLKRTWMRLFDQSHSGN